MMSRRFVSAVCVLLVLVQTLGCTQLTRVRDNIQSLRQVKRRVFQQTEPKTADDPSMELLTKEMDWLEQQIDTFGTIVPKHPDVWGEARLTKYRQAVEAELAKELPKFTSTLQGNVQRSDSAFLSIAATLNSVASGQTAPAPANANNLLVNSGSPLSPTPTLTPPKTPDTPSSVVSLEPNVFVDQMNRYLNHLNELRRINNGDDTSDSPGYALRLVRIPISVLPGKRTRRGYAAELTVTAEPHLGDDLLPRTFRSLVVNDLVQQLTLPITKAVNDPRMDEIYRAIHKAQDSPFNTVKLQTPEYIQEFEKAVYPVTVEIGNNISTTKNRRSRFSFPPKHLTQNYGLYAIGNVALDAWAGLRNLPPSNAPHPNQVIHLIDVQGFLDGEVNAAYDLLSQPDMVGLWETYCTPELVRLVRERKVEGLKLLRQQFQNDALLRSDYVNGTHTTIALAWAIILESALLNDRLIQDVRDLAGKQDCCLDPQVELPFFGPNPSLEARESFKQYVKCRWPVKVFALDPVEQDQNVAETYGRRRELQLAMAISVATGNMSANAATRFARTLETDIQSIDLNKTAVGFSHGNDTFGWRFMPRLQSPPTPTTLQTISQELGGGPTPDQDLRDRMLEPGVRECTAIIVMPSFVQYVDFHTRANWNGLTNPARERIDCLRHDAAE